MIEKQQKRKINYYLKKAKEETISVFEADIEYNKLYNIINELPFINKEEYFDIIRLEKNKSKEKGYSPELSSVLNNRAIINKLFSIISFEVSEDNIADNTFITSDSITSTDGYDVFVKWKERTELAIYLSEFLADGRVEKAIDLDLLKIVTEISKLEISPLEQQELFQSIFSCFTFNHIEDISYGIINSIKLASCYELFNLSSTNTHLQKIADLAEKNLEATNYDFIVDENKENNKSITTYCSISSEQQMLNEDNSFGNIAAFYQDYQKLKSDHYFICNILNDEGDLYRYHGTIDYIGLYEFVKKINTKYCTKQKRKFEVVSWDSYKKIPIIEEYLDPDVANNKYYKITNIDISAGKIDVRNNLAKNISVEWTEVPKISIIIDKLLSDFVSQPEINISLITKAIDNIETSSEDKKELTDELFSHFSLDLFEIIPGTIITAIEETPTKKTINLENTKNNINQSISIGKTNNLGISVLENDKVKIKRIINK